MEPLHDGPPYLPVPRASDETPSTAQPLSGAGIAPRESGAAQRNSLCSKDQDPNVNWNVAPRPGFALTHRRPPCDSIIFRLIDNPIPVP